MATTGRRQATASISTPEVTWSSESYGSTTTSASPPGSAGTPGRGNGRRSGPGRPDPEGIGLGHQPVPVGLTSRSSTCGWVSPATRYRGAGRDRPAGHRLDRPLDALARSEQAPRQHGRPVHARPGTAAGRPVGRSTVGDQDHLRPDPPCNRLQAPAVAVCGHDHRGIRDGAPPLRGRAR